MDCQQAGNLFDAYLDGELSPSLATELHAHRLQCPSCRQELAVMEVAGHVIASGADQPELGGHFTDRLLACLEPRVHRVSPVRTWVIRIGGTLATAAGIMLAVGYFSRPEPQVAAERVTADGQAVVRHEEPATPDPPSPGLDEAAVNLRRTLENAVRETQQSSTSLVQFGRMTLLQMVEALQLEELRESDAPYESFPEDAPGDDADDIQEL